MTAMTALNPTNEQLQALVLFKTGKSVAIEAGAGTGKTSTLNLLASNTPRRGQYVAFNKAIVEDAKRAMPGTVRCNTAHSLAWQSVSDAHRNRVFSKQRMRSWELAALLGIEDIVVTTFLGARKRIEGSFLAGHAMRAVEVFCQSADLEPSVRHVPFIDGLDDPGTEDRPRSYAVNNAISQHLLGTMREAWVDLVRPDGRLPFDHAHYLKMWQLSNPRLKTDFIMFDECQDASPVMLAVVDGQDAQKVFVGDAQQAIYEWTGAVNALARIKETGECDRTFLSQSFRFGDDIAEVANVVLSLLNADLRLVGFEQIQSTVDWVADPRCVLARTNATVVRTALNAQRIGKKVHMVGGTGEIMSFTRGAVMLMDGRRTSHPELACFESWDEVREYVSQDSKGIELRLMVNLIDEFGTDTILGLQASVPENRADVIVSTAHKSKGREWPTVKLASDFPGTATGMLSPSELRLLYVACTRAKLMLDITDVPFMMELMGP